MKYQESKEDYLETIMILSNRKDSETGKRKKVHAIDIVHERNYSKPSVSIAMKKLLESGDININDKGEISLTSKGKKTASCIYERHETLRKTLISLGVSKEVAAEDACKIEHYLSKESFQAIKSYINRMKKEN
ncbi:MAG: metal-dependent transcriptional regulator [Bacilli bacterium]